jgi:hypothetical protein
MRTRGAAIQGGLAALGLVAAYATWQREPERAPGEAVVFDLGKSDITKIRYEDGTKWVELEPKPAGADEDAARVWLRVSAKPDAKPQPIPERVLRGNDGAQRLVDKFAPLRATRALGTLEAAKLKEFGLAESKKKIEVTARGDKRVLVVGTSPFGVSDPYVKDERDGRVYVLGGGVLTDLDNAGVRLVDRALHTIKGQDFDALTVEAGGKKRELVQTSAETPLAAKLASKKTPQKPDELAKNWHDKVWRLIVTEALGKDELPAGGAPQPALRIEYTLRGKTRGFLELGRVNAPAPANTSMPPAATVEIFGRSEHTAGWVKVPANAEDLLKEAEKVAAAE